MLFAFFSEEVDNHRIIFIYWEMSMHFSLLYALKCISEVI